VICDRASALSWHHSKESGGRYNGATKIGRRIDAPRQFAAVDRANWISFSRTSASPRLSGVRVRFENKCVSGLGRSGNRLERWYSWLHDEIRKSREAAFA
jgi:hypothetical protein